MVHREDAAVAEAGDEQRGDAGTGEHDEAAQAIVVGQGGDLTLGFLEKGRALWRLELPVADA